MNAIETIVLKDRRLVNHEHDVEYKRLKSARTPLIANPSGNYTEIKPANDRAVYNLRSKWFKNDLNSILVPSQDIEAVHKIRPGNRMRSVYFDRTPRKAR